MDQVIAFLSGSGEMIYLMIFIAIIALGGIILVNMFQEAPPEEPPKTHRTTEVSEEEKRRALKRLGIDPNDPNRRPDRW